MIENIEKIVEKDLKNRRSKGKKGKKGKGKSAAKSKTHKTVSRKGPGSFAGTTDDRPSH